MNPPLLQEFIEEILSPPFGGMIAFVKEAEALMEKGQLERLKNEEGELWERAAFVGGDTSWVVIISRSLTTIITAATSQSAEIRVFLQVWRWWRRLADAPCWSCRAVRCGLSSSERPT